jgi:hypothetical protein
MLKHPAKITVAASIVFGLAQPATVANALPSWGSDSRTYEVGDDISGLLYTLTPSVSPTGADYGALGISGGDYVGVSVDDGCTELPPGISVTWPGLSGAGLRAPQGAPFYAYTTASWDSAGPAPTQVRFDGTFTTAGSYTLCAWEGVYGISGPDMAVNRVTITVNEAGAHEPVQSRKIPSIGKAWTKSGRKTVRAFILNNNSWGANTMSCSAKYGGQVNGSGYLKAVSRATRVCDYASSLYSATTSISAQSRSGANASRGTRITLSIEP